MTPVDLIADLRSRINPAYANQIGTESWERKLCADALEEQASAIDLLHSWVADAQARNGLLEQHLRAVLEVARVWQPEYATKMDLDTMQYAQDCADGKVPNFQHEGPGAASSRTVPSHDGLAGDAQD